MAADDPKETLTIRLPKGLKDLVDKAAEDRETTVTSLVREALQETLHPTGRMYEHPGFSKKFEEFYKDRLKRSKPVILLVADEGTGRRYFCSGIFVGDFCNESLVAIAAPGSPWIIPRRDVVAWYDGELLPVLATALSRQGWAPRPAA